MTRILRLLLALTLSAAAAPSRADQPRSVPDTPANFTLSGDQRWIVAAVRQDGEAAIGVAREQFYEDMVQVARTRDGKYAILVGPQPEQNEDEVKSRFEGRGFKDAHQSRGEEFVARAWQGSSGKLAAAQMQDGKPATLKHGALTVTLRLVQTRKKKNDESYVVVADGRDDGKPAFTIRGETVFSPGTPAKVSAVKLEGDVPQAAFTYYTMGAHCCAMTTIATKGAAGKWQVLPPLRLDGDAGPYFEDLDGDGTQEMLSGDNRFLYEFSPYASSVMPSKIEKMIGGRIVDVTRRPEYRRYLVQYLAQLEDRAEPDNWKESGFLAGWAAQKVLLGEGEQAFARIRQSFDPTTGAPFEECTIDRPIEKCPAKNKRTVSFETALRTFLEKNGYK
jgi:hypothetical protein